VPALLGKGSATRGLFQIHSLHGDETVPQHVDRGLGLFQDDVTDKWFVLAIVGLHFDEEHLVRRIGCYPLGENVSNHRGFREVCWGRRGVVCAFLGNREHVCR